MPDRHTQTPVALLVFNRPHLTRRVFDVIRQVRPRELLIVADGPRPYQPNDAADCAEVRAIVQQVDWPCEVQTNFSEVNLGCRRRISSGLNWVFGLVEEAIILEDDCLPHPTFFRFCEELLETHRADTRIMHIGGASFQAGHGASPNSYFYSRYPHVWGWASWRRAWQHYDVGLSAWAAAPDKTRFLSLFEKVAEQDFWRMVWNAVSAGRIDTWDYQWAFACLLYGGLSIVPTVNLVSNVGFGKNATNTRRGSLTANLPLASMPFPLRHPPTVTRDAGADEQTRRLFFVIRNPLRRVVASLRRRSLSQLP